jgi:hypothetical protein
MRKTNEELVASGAKAIPIYKQIGAAIFSWETALILAVTAAQIVVQKWDSISKVFSKTGNELKEIAAESKKTAAQETANAKALAAVAQDVSQSMNIRIEAVKKLQSAYPNYLGNLSKEAILTGETADAMERLNEALINKSIMEAYSEKVGEQAKKFAELQDSLEKYEGKVQEADSRFKQLNNGSTNQYAINSRTRAAQDKANAEREVETIKKKIAETEKEMDRYQKQAEKFGKLAAGVLVGKEDPKKSPKGRTAKDMELKSESELLKAEYELSKQRVEQDAQIQKEIADNEKNTINQRLDAYMEYTADVLQLLRMAKDYELKQEDLKIQDIKRKKKNATATELIALQEQEDAANVRYTGIKEKFQSDLSDVERKGNKDRLAILNTGNEQWIKSEEFRNAKLKEQQVTWYLTQEALLKKALDAKEITTKEYNTRLRNLQKQEGQMLLDDDIDLYTRLLENKTLSAEKQLEIQNKLNAALKQKSQGGAADAGKRPSGRLTDSLGKSLGIVEEDALQEFYDRTVQLANQAADAIIAAKERQFQAEQDMLDKQKEGIQANYEMQLDYINATTRNETERANKIAQLQAQKSAQDESIEQKKREVAKRQANASKIAAMASIVQNTAIAIAGALKYGPAAPAIIALITAAGATQLAIAANTPVPAYKEGTNYHKGGMFIAGDGGQKELIIAPNKKPYFSASTSTLYNEAAGTKVIPGDVVKQMENNITSTASYGGSVMPSIDYDRLAKLIGQEFAQPLWQHGENLSHTIMAARTKMPKQDMREAVLQLQRLGK